MFPSRDMMDGFERFLERDRVHQLLIDAHPTLADRIEIDEANPLLTIPTGYGGAVILRKGEVDGIIRWRLAAPDGDGVKVLGPDSIEEFPRLVGEALSLGSRDRREERARMSASDACGRTRQNPRWPPPARWPPR